jgi:hypothetical protein
MVLCSNEPWDKCLKSHFGLLSLCLFAILVIVRFLAVDMWDLNLYFTFRVKLVWGLYRSADVALASRISFQARREDNSSKELTFGELIIKFDNRVGSRG